VPETISRFVIRAKAGIQHFAKKLDPGLRRDDEEAQPTQESMHELEPLIDDAWQRRADLSNPEIDATLKPAIERVLDALEQGALRVAEPDGAGGWRTHQWVKKAVLLYFRVS